MLYKQSIYYIETRFLYNILFFYYIYFLKEATATILGFLKLHFFLGCFWKFFILT